jgi:hypothetical protein
MKVYSKFNCLRNQKLIQYPMLLGEGKLETETWYLEDTGFIDLSTIIDRRKIITNFSCLKSEIKFDSL